MISAEEKKRMAMERLASAEGLVRLIPMDLDMAADDLLDRRDEGWARKDFYPISNKLRTAERLVREAYADICRLREGEQ